MKRMKKMAAIGAAAALTLTMCVYGGHEGREIFSCYDLEVQEFAEGFEQTDIVSVFYRRNHETAEEYVLQEDKEQIGRLFQAISEVKVLGKTEGMASDYDDIFIFTLPTAQAFTFSFNQHHLKVGTSTYELEHDEELWRIADEIASGAVQSDEERGNTDGNKEPAVQESEGGSSDIEITPTEAKTVTWQEYETADFKMKVPEGWKVTAGSYGMTHSIRVYDPENTVNQVFVLLKALPLLHDETGKTYYQQSQQMYGDTYAVMANAPVLSDPSTAGFFQIFSEYASFAESIEPSYYGYKFPRFYEFSTIESLESSSMMASVSLGSQILWASFTDADGLRGEGMFTADVVDMTGDQLSGFGVDGGYYAAYNIVALTAGEDTLQEWQEVLSECLGSLEYIDSFVKNAMAQSDAEAERAGQLGAELSGMSDQIMEAWNHKNESEEIMRQKQSDSTLGYERIYDTEKDKVYRAPLGWSDQNDEERYQPVTGDELYTRPLDGYIEW